MQSTFSISDLALMMWRYWRANEHDDMPTEVFYQYVSRYGFRFMDEELFLNDEDDPDKTAWYVAKYGDVEDAFMEHVNSEKAFADFLHFRHILSLYVEPRQKVAGIAELNPMIYLTHSN